MVEAVKGAHEPEERLARHVFGVLGIAELLVGIAEYFVDITAIDDHQGVAVAILRPPDE